MPNEIRLGRPLGWSGWLPYSIKPRKQMSGFDYAAEAELFDYSIAAELFSSKGRKVRHQTLGYKRFARAADAIRFAIEELAPQLFVGTYLEVDDARYDSKDIRRLYESAGYPHTRSAAVPLR